jgi:hypothetical protein
MTEQKKSRNPFIAAAQAAKNSAANPSIPGARTAPVQKARFGAQVQGNKPAKKSAGRGR